MAATSTTRGASRPRPAPSRWERIDGVVDGLLARRSSGASRDIALADALRVVAAAMRSGSTVQGALARAAERGGSDAVARACGVAAARIALGRPVETEIDAFAAQVDTAAARLFAQVVRVQHRRGGDIGGPCHRLAALLHDRTRLDAEARSATAQARFSARAVIAIPFLLAAATAWRAPHAAAQFLHPGPLLLASPGIALIAAGALVARRIATTACSLGAGTADPRAARRGALRHLVRRIGGTGPRARSGARLGLAAGAC
ncbi:MAG: hypothetical protein JWM98_591, partial [Thermoleophilia bacterium]|nr:hypothetical protein [Thermoleophilia bacterium]